MMERIPGKKLKSELINQIVVINVHFIPCVLSLTKPPTGNWHFHTLLHSPSALARLVHGPNFHPILAPPKEAVQHLFNLDWIPGQQGFTSVRPQIRGAVSTGLGMGHPVGPWTQPLRGCFLLAMCRQFIRGRGGLGFNLCRGMRRRI
jgi:hypothetical protein